MTHRLTVSGIVGPAGLEFCHHNSKRACDPIQCIGAEVLTRGKKGGRIVRDGKSAPDYPHKVVSFYCMPQPREVRLKEY